VVTGTDELGAWMTARPAVSKITITFADSTATGRKVAAAAATSLRRVTLKLGGNEAAIVVNDAQPDTIAESLFWGAFTNNGQVCVAVKRLYVHESMFDGLVERLTTLASGVRVGNAHEPGNQLGPINNRPQFHQVSHPVENALAQGARATAGGAPLPGHGYFYPPTILIDAPDVSVVVAGEQFDPALSVLSYRDLENAIERANATKFGLGGSVWSGDPERAAVVAERVVCGTAWVNTHGAVPPWQPPSGASTSGIGTENGVGGVHEYWQQQVVRVERTPA
jgi:acyl-CoA reductase-like NAD-dependent aldehyde dehydrogenase